MKTAISATDLLAQVAGQTDGAELFELRSLAMPVHFAASALESVKSVETTGRALRVIRDGRLGFSTTTDMADGKTVVGNALESAQFGDAVTLRFPKKKRMPAVQCFDPEVELLDEESLIALGEGIIEEIRSYDPELHIEVFAGKEIEEVRLLNTSGLEIGDRRTSLSVSVEVTRAREGDILVVSDSAASRWRRDVDGVALAQRIVERLRWAEKTAPVESKAMPVVFNPRGTLVLLLPLMPGLNGRYVCMGASPLGQKMGEQAFDSRFTLVDDGRLDFAIRSAPHDDEGVPTAENPLIEGGTVRQFLYDLKTAAQAGAQPTGNGFKAGLQGGGFRQPPDIAPSTWIVSPGNRSLEQILGELDEALLVDSVLGLGQGNTLAGEFSNNVSLGFLVRRGEIAGRVKNTMIAGNIYELLKEHLIGIADHAEWAFGMLRVPAIAVDRVGVASQ